MTSSERLFWAKVNKLGPVHPVLKTRCWLWTGYTLRGYGRLTVKQKSRRAHRYAWFLHYGVYPTHNANHHCDNPTCVRWSHLFDAPQDVGMQDKVNKNRQLKGESAYNAVLTTSAVLAIRARCHDIGMTHPQLAREYGTTRANIQAITAGRSWKHLLEGV